MARVASLGLVLLMGGPEAEAQVNNLRGGFPEASSSASSVASSSDSFSEGESERRLFQANPDFLRFCGIAANAEQGNGFDQSDLAHAVSFVGHGKVWQYNWAPSSNIGYPFVQYVPMLKTPGYDANALPPPDANGGSGSVVKGWNEPDDPAQSGADWNLRSNPAAYAGAWTEQMRKAEAKGYHTFVAPAMAQDSCWLDHFLKGCEGYQDCKRYVTHLAFHRYRADCASYTADPNNMGFRDDLSYLLSFYRLMKKYNARGFNIRGLAFDEIGCYNGGWPAEEWMHMRYLEQFFRDTVANVKAGDQGTMEKIRNTQWIMPKGPDAHQVGKYWVGQCHGEDGGPNAGAEAVLAIQSIATVAWFSIQKGHNFLFNKGSANGLSPVGELYLSACKTVDAAAQPFTFVELVNGATIRLRNVASGRSLALAAGVGSATGQAIQGSAEVGTDLWRLVKEADSFRLARVTAAQLKAALPLKASHEAPVSEEGEEEELIATPGEDEERGFGTSTVTASNATNAGRWQLHAEESQEMHFKIENLDSKRWLYEAGEKGVVAGAVGNGGGAVWRLEIVPADELAALSALASTAAAPPAEAEQQVGAAAR